jgi:hypothetical protein
MRNVRASFVVLLWALLPAAMAKAQAAPPDLAGVFWATRYNAKIEVLGGGELPLTPAGKAAYERAMAGLRDGSIIDEARKFCLPDGVPRVLATPYPFQIFQQPGQIAMVHELNHQVRIIPLDKPVEKNFEVIALPHYNGHAFGRYEGDTLVVETIGFNEKTFLDATGAPHTDELHTIERIRKISPAELEIIVTIRDPAYYSHDWQARFVYTLRKDVRLEDYICGEPHRDISSVEGVRRP